MKKVLISTLVLLLLVCGCAPYRQPAPESRPPTQELPNEPVRPDQNTPLGQNLAADISARTKESSAVQSASALVIGDLAIIGLQLRDGRDADTVEDSIAEDIEKTFSEVSTALVTSDLELTDQIAAASDLINQGRPTIDVLDRVFQIWKSIRPQ